MGIEKKYPLWHLAEKYPEDYAILRRNHSIRESLQILAEHLAAFPGLMKQKDKKP